MKQYYCLIYNTEPELNISLVSYPILKTGYFNYLVTDYFLHFIGEWYGIEWDDPDRGKHDGTHEGVKYFECR